MDWVKAAASWLFPPARRTRPRGRSERNGKPRRRRTPDVLRPQGATKVTKAKNYVNGKVITTVRRTSPGGGFVQETIVEDNDHETETEETSEDDDTIAIETGLPLPEDVLDSALKKLPPPVPPNGTSKPTQPQRTTPPAPENETSGQDTFGQETSGQDNQHQPLEEQEAPAPSGNLAGITTTSRTPNKKAAKTQAELNAYVRHWADEEIGLFNQLNERGFRALMPSTWQADFSTVPLINFSTELDSVFLRSDKGDDFRATKALKQLFALGSRVRDRVMLKQEPSLIILKEILAYVKWSEMDGSIAKNDNLIPLLAIEVKLPDESFNDLANRTQKRMHGFAARYREAWLVNPSDGDDADDEEPKDKGKGKEKVTTPSPPETSQTGGGSSKKRKHLSDTEEDKLQAESSTSAAKRQKTGIATSATSASTSTMTGPVYKRRLPVVFGLTIAHSVVGICSHDASKPGKPIRNLATFNFGKDGQDVWNGLAVAILIVWVRNSLVRIWNQMIQDGEVDGDQ